MPDNAYLDLGAIERRAEDLESTNAPTVLELADDVLNLVARLRDLEGVLEYICRPTMALPGDRDPEDFARTDAADDQVRLALATCIHMATHALGRHEP